MLQTKDVNYAYDTQTQFRFPDIQCHAGEALLITGKSGTGKTTLLHLLAGILSPKSGEIIIDNTAIEKLNPTKADKFRGKNIGLILQKSYFIEALSVLENIETAAFMAQKTKKTLKAKELLIKMDLSNQMHKLPSTLSVGQQQRANIARALINEPKVILADEPTSNLDDENTAVVAQLLMDLAKTYRAALIIVTHDNRLQQLFNQQIHLV